MGFRRLAGYIIAEYPEQVNARGGSAHSPLAAALYKSTSTYQRYQHSAAVDVPGFNNRSLLLAVSADGLVDIV